MVISIRLRMSSRQFLAAHAFASVQPRAGHLGKLPRAVRSSGISPRPMSGSRSSPVVDWENAQSGYGYLELGRERGIDGAAYPYALNFDVIAHEIGHAICSRCWPSRWTGWQTAISLRSTKPAPT